MSITKIADDVMGMTGMTNKALTMRVIKAALSSVVIRAGSGETVTIKGFGSFKRVNRVGRRYTTPTGDVIVKPGRTKLQFRCTGNQITQTA